MTTPNTKYKKEEKKIPNLRFPGFKDGWMEKRLGELCSTFKSGTGITSERISNNGRYPVFGGNGLRGYTNSFTHDGLYVLIGRQGALCGNINSINGKSYISEHAIAAAGNENSDTEWLAQRLEFYKLNRLSESSAQPGLAVNKLVRLKLIVPSKPEQQKIASFLSVVDQKIQQLTRKKELLELYKKGVMQKIFSREIRFKNENGNVYPDWEEKRLGEVCEIKGRIGYRGYTVNDIVEKGEGAIAISPSNINNGQLDYDKSTYISWFKYEESPEIKLEINDTLLVKTGSTYGKSAFVKTILEPATVNPQLVVLKRTNINPLYLSYIVFHDIVQKQIYSTVVGGAIPTLSQESISNFQIPKPCLLEQQKIADYLSIIDNKIESIQTQINQTQQFKKGLLQQMFV